MSTATVDPVADFLATNASPPPEVGADLIRNGRYQIPHPVTGKPTSFQRASNFAKGLDNSEGLTKWKLRMLATGLTQRDDLHIAAAAAVGEQTHDETKAKKDLDRVIEAAIDAAGGTAAATTGTALHSFLERINRGERNVDAPAAWRADLTAYRKEVERLGLDPIRHEVLVVNTRLGVAGRFDLLGRTAHRPLPMVMDYKTGRVDGKALPHALQLVCYATADFIYDPTTGTHEPMPEVDLTEALIIHLPQGEGTCTTYSIDLVRVIELAKLAWQVRENRSGNKGLQVVFDATAGTWPTPEPVSETARVLEEPPEDRTTWIRQRLIQLAHDPKAREIIAYGWPLDTPAQPPWTDDQVEGIAYAIAAAEKAIGASFPAPDPEAPALGNPVAVAEDPGAPPRAPDWPTGDDGTAADPGDVTAVKAAVAALDPAQQALVVRWAKEAQRTGARFDEGHTVRQVAVMDAAVRCVEAFWSDDETDELVRAALATCRRDIPENAYAIVLDPSWHTGAVLGRLTYDEALRLTQIAAGFAAGDDDVTATLGALVVAATAASTSTTNPNTQTQENQTP